MSPYKEKIGTDNLGIGSGKLLTQFQRNLLQKNLRLDLSESYRQRLQIMLLADEGKTQAEICRALGCSSATVRHWMHVARIGMAHQWQDSPMGRPKSVNDEYLERLKELATSSPRDYGYSFQQWTGICLSKHLAKEFGIEVTSQHINRLLKQMGLSNRRKRNNSSEKEIIKVNTPKILICDLKPPFELNNTEFLPINFVALGIDPRSGSAQNLNNLTK